MVRSRFELYTGTELVWRKDFFKEGAELNFAPCASGLDIREDAFEIAYAGSEALHFSESTMDFFKSLGDFIKGIAQSLFEG